MAAVTRAVLAAPVARLSSRRVASQTPQTRAPTRVSRGASLVARSTVSIEHQGKTYEVECDGFDSILDAAIDAGIEDLSYDCKMGVCMTCPSKVTGGKVTQDGAMLSDDVADMGYALLCVALPDGQDVKIETVTEEELLDVQLCA